MRTNPQGIGHDGQRGIDGTDGGHEACVHDIEIIEVVGLAVGVENAVGWIFPEAAGPHLMRGSRNVHGLKKNRKETDTMKHLSPLGAEPSMTLAVFGLPMQADHPIGVEGNAIVGIRQVFCGKPPVH